MTSGTERFLGPGMTAYVTTSNFKNTGNSEGEVTYGVRILADGGEVLLDTSIDHDWYYFSSMEVKFSSKDKKVTLDIHNGPSTVYDVKKRDNGGIYLTGRPENEGD